MPSSAGPPPPPPALSFLTAGHGHFRGTATSGQDTFIAEALLTVDGALRIAVWGPNDGQGVLSGAGFWDDDLRAEESIQFVGSIKATSGDQGLGSGVIIGQICSPPDPGRFCTEAAPAQISMTALPGGDLNGEIRVTTSEGEETLLVDVGAWSLYYTDGVRPVDPSDMYKEELAPFVQVGDVIITIDDARQLFFQDADSGCTGNGTLAPHLDGTFYVFDVILTIENCHADFGFLNTEFTGLATETQNGAWDYDNWLLMFLSTPDGSASQAAVTMYAGAID